MDPDPGEERTAVAEEGALVTRLASSKKASMINATVLEALEKASATVES